MIKIDNPDIVAAILTSAMINKFNFNGDPQDGDKITYDVVEKYKEVFNKVSSFASEIKKLNK